MYLIRQMQTISEATDQKQGFGPNHFSLDDSHCGSGDGGVMVEVQIGFWYGNFVYMNLYTLLHKRFHPCTHFALKTFNISLYIVETCSINTKVHFQHIIETK